MRAVRKRLRHALSHFLISDHLRTLEQLLHLVSRWGSCLRSASRSFGLQEIFRANSSCDARDWSPGNKKGGKITPSMHFVQRWAPINRSDSEDSKQREHKHKNSLDRNNLGQNKIQMSKKNKCVHVVCGRTL